MIFVLVESIDLDCNFTIFNFAILYRFYKISWVKSFDFDCNFMIFLVCYLFSIWNKISILTILFRIIFGFGFWGLYRFSALHEQHSFVVISYVVHVRLAQDNIGSNNIGNFYKKKHARPLCLKKKKKRIMHILCER